MTLQQILRRLLHGREEMYLPAAWLGNVEQLREYEIWTLRQREGMVVTGALDMKRRELWARALGRKVEENVETRGVLPFRRRR